jgi:endonuclease YncB( thermonuclease family)
VNYPARILLCLCGLCLLLGIRIGGQSVIEARKSGPASSARPEPQDPPSAGTPKMASSVEHRQVRRIFRGEEGGAIVSSDLERLPPRAPSEQQSLPPSVKQAAGNAGSQPAVAPADPKKRTQTTLYRPIAEATGVLDADGYRVILAGIEPVTKDKTCPLSTGGTWPCGLVARSAFRAWLRGRALTCEVPAAKGSVTASCTVGDDDPALWLVENGWASSGDARYSDAANKAREEKKGMFGDPPKAYSPMPALASPAPAPQAGGAASGETP